MFRGFTGLLRCRRVLSPGTRAVIQQRAGSINSKPPKDNIGPMESAFVMTVLTVALLGPSGWILSHLDDYKNRG